MSSHVSSVFVYCFFFFQAEDGIRDLVRSRGLGDVYKRQREEAMIELVVALRNDSNPPTLTDEMTNQFKQTVKDIDQISALALPYMILSLIHI